MRAIVFALSVAALASCAVSPASDERALLSLQSQWASARVAQDTAFLDRFYTPDFRIFALNGSVVARAEDIANFASGALRPESIVHEDMSVRLYGDVALVTGIERVRGSYRGVPGEFALRFTNVYVRESGNWRLAHHHSTPMAAP